MNTNQTSTQAVEAPAAEQTAGAKLTARTKLTALAWGVIFIGSMAPTIILRLFIPAVSTESVMPAWLGWTKVVVLAVLVAVTWIWPIVKPLRGLALALLAFWVGALFSAFLLDSAVWSNWVQGASWGVALVATIFVRHLILIAPMTLTLIGSGLGRRELFLTRGNPSAPAQPSRLLNIKEPKPWTRVARNFILVFAIITAIVVWLDVRPDVSQISQALIYLPAIIIAAALNAFGEEFEYRSMLLSRLEPVVRPGQAMLMTALLFASLHYYTGTPSGPIGAIAVTFLGWVAAKSVLETRGLVWAFTLHFIVNIIIFAFYAMTV